MVSSLQCLFCLLNFCFQVSCESFLKRACPSLGFHKKCFLSSHLPATLTAWCAAFIIVQTVLLPHFRFAHCTVTAEGQKLKPIPIKLIFISSDAEGKHVTILSTPSPGWHPPLTVLSADYMQEFRCHPLEHLLLNHLSFIKVLECLQWQKKNLVHFLNSGFSVTFHFPLLLDCFTVNMKRQKWEGSLLFLLFSQPYLTLAGSCFNTMALNPGCMFITCGACQISTVDLWNQNFWGLSLNTSVFFEVLKIF